MTKEPRWGQVTAGTWLTVHCDNRERRVDTVVGYIRPLGEQDMGVSLVRDSRWALGFYRTEEATEPFFVLPGCQVRGIQFFNHAVQPGFVEWQDPEQKGEYLHVTLR